MSAAVKSQSEPTGMQFIQPMSITLSIDGTDLTITPLVLAELPNVLGLGMPIFASLGKIEPGLLERMSTGAVTETEMSGLLTSIMVNGEDYIGLLALCCRQPPAWVGKLLLDRAAELAAVCLQVNADFFRRAMPNIRAMASQITLRAAAQQASATRTPSSNS